MAGMLYLMALGGIALLIGLMVYSDGSDTDYNAVRAKARQQLGEVMDADEYCREKGLSRSDLMGKIDRREVKAYAKGPFLFIQKT